MNEEEANNTNLIAGTHGRNQATPGFRQSTHQGTRKRCPWTTLSILKILGVSEIECDPSCEGRATHF